MTHGLRTADYAAPEEPGPAADAALGAGHLTSADGGLPGT